VNSFPSIVYRGARIDTKTLCQPLVAFGFKIFEGMIGGGQPSLGAMLTRSSSGMVLNTSSDIREDGIKLTLSIQAVTKVRVKT
jgi:hypothetical protein